jgi:hypothetical protein
MHWLLAGLALASGCTGIVSATGASERSPDGGDAPAPDAAAPEPDSAAPLPPRADAGTFSTDAGATDAALADPDASTARERFLDLGVGMGPSAYHSCAMQPGGDVVCWGNAQSRAMPPVGLRGVALSSGHSHNCVIAPPGESERVVCFGYGEGAVAPDGLVDPVQVSVGQLISCVLERDGSVVCWGRDDLSPEPPADLRATYVAACGAFACAITLDGSVVCWGASPPELPDPDLRALQIAVAQHEATALGPTERPRHACAVRLDHSVVCWGDDVGGEVSAVPAGLRAREVAVGYRQACAIALDGSVVCWGTAAGDVAMPEGLRGRALRMHHLNGCALDEGSDTMTCWGRDDRRQASGPDGDAVYVPAS